MAIFASGMELLKRKGLQKCTAYPAVAMAIFASGMELLKRKGLQKCTAYPAVACVLIDRNNG